MTEIKRVGFIGLGNMGGPMCGHLARAGFEVTRLRPRRGALVARAVEAGATRGASSASTAPTGPTALITMLPAPPQVEQVLLGAAA